MSLHDNVFLFIVQHAKRSSTRTIRKHIPGIHLFHPRRDNCRDPLKLDVITRKCYERLFYRNYAIFGTILTFCPSLLFVGLLRENTLVGT